MQKVLLSLTLLFVIISCSDHRLDPTLNENPSTFTEIASIVAMLVPPKSVLMILIQADFLW